MLNTRQPTADNRTSVTRQHGSLDLVLAQVSGITRPARCLAVPPLQLSRVRYDQAAQPGAASLTLLHLGGILDHDRYTIAITLGERAEASVIGAAATLAYRMPVDEAHQEVRLHLADESRLRWLPGPLILFGGARFGQRITIKLGARARLDMIDLLVPGRLARGECFQFNRYTQELEVTDGAGRLLYAERMRLEPSRRTLAALGLLDINPVLGSLYMFGEQLNATAISAFVAQRSDRLVGATPLPNGCGVLIRARGTLPHAVGSYLSTLRAEVAAQFDIHGTQ